MELIKLKIYNGRRLRHVYYRENGDVLTYKSPICEHCPRKPALSIVDLVGDCYTVKDINTVPVKIPSAFVEALLKTKRIEEEEVLKSTEQDIDDPWE